MVSLPAPPLRTPATAPGVNGDGVMTRAANNGTSVGGSRHHRSCQHPCYQRYRYSREHRNRFEGVMLSALSPPLMLEETDWLTAEEMMTVSLPRPPPMKASLRMSSGQQRQGDRVVALIGFERAPTSTTVVVADVTRVSLRTPPTTLL